MAARTVVDPQGRTWRVRRRWLTRTAHWRGPWSPADAFDVLDGADLLGAGAELPVIGWILLVAALTLLLVGAFALLLPLLLLLGELVVVLLALVGGAAARILLRRPWIVEARVEGTNEGRQWKVVGWRATDELIAKVAERIHSTGRAGDVTWTPHLSR